MKKLYIVSREVWAENIEKAIRTRGAIFKVSEAEEQGVEPKKKNKTGFKSLSSKKKK